VEERGARNRGGEGKDRKEGTEGTKGTEREEWKKGRAGEGLAMVPPTTDSFRCLWVLLGHGS